MSRRPRTFAWALVALSGLALSGLALSGLAGAEPVQATQAPQATQAAQTPPPTPPAAAAAPGFSNSVTRALEVSRATVGRPVSADLAFTRSDGSRIRLGELRGQPVVISLIYTSCYHTCPTITQTLARAVSAARNALGAGRFQVLTIGFDTRVDTPEAMRRYARQQGADLQDWAFLATDNATLERLAGALGFTFYPSPKGFEHLAQTTLLDKDGVIYRHVYGETFDLPQLVEPLKDLVLGRHAALTSLTALADRVRLFCTVYDPRMDAYRFDYSLFVETGLGFASLLSMVLFAGYAWRNSRRSRNRETSAKP